MKVLSSYFKDGQLIPSDPILGITQRYSDDSNPDKIDCGVGIFRIKKDIKFIPDSIIKAASLVTVRDWPQGYLSPTGEREWSGDERFLSGSIKIVFGELANNLLDSHQIAACGTSGGTGALALYAQALAFREPGCPVLIGKPTWGPHRNIFESRGLKVIEYNHVKNNGYDLEAHLLAVKKSSPNTKVLFHAGRTHNPTGLNPSTTQEWQKLARAMNGRVAIFDSAYAGFVDGLTEDTQAIRTFINEGVPVAVAFSFSKNAGLYEHRVGALLIPVSGASVVDTQRLLNISLRVIDSSPAAYGELVMAQVFSDPSLLQKWKEDLQFASSELKKRRELLGDLIPQFGFLKNQFGLFSKLPFKAAQIVKLEKEMGVYMVGDGRINIGGVPTQEIGKLADTFKRVLES